jgi:hypothetical protein
MDQRAPAKEDFVMASEGSCEVRIVRRGGYADALRSYRILVNGREVGAIARDSVLDIKVPPGRATIEARLDWGRSRPLTIEASPGRRTEIEVSNNWGALLSLWAITIGFRSYLALRPIA